MARFRRGGNGPKNGIGRVHPKNSGRKSGRYGAAGGGNKMSNPMTRDPRTPHGAQHQWGTPGQTTGVDFMWSGQGQNWGQNININSTNPQCTWNWDCECHCVWEANQTLMPGIGQQCPPMYSGYPIDDMEGYSCQGNYCHMHFVTSIGGGGWLDMTCTTDNDCNSDCHQACQNIRSQQCGGYVTQPVGGY
tara:strand:+ start:921 stop:1490 length:570 start_codon:yes stop_codon:yes gene_type:complete